MKYNQPFDQPLNPNAGYIDGNPSAGVAGSIPPAAQMEYPQREIVNVIAAAGLTPDNGDLYQMLRAIRGDLLSYFEDQGSQNQIAIAPLPTYIGMPNKGTRWRVKLAKDITSTSTFQLNGNAPVPVRKAGSVATSGGEGFSGDIVTLTWDGTYVQISGGSGGASTLIPNANVVLNVPGQYPSIRAAVAAASRIFLPIDVYGQISVADGWVENCNALTGPIQLPGAFGERWSIVASTPTGGVPTASDIAGKSNADTLALYRSRFKVEVRCVGTSAFEMRSGVWSMIYGLLVTGDQTNNGGSYGIKVGDWSTRVGAAVLGLSSVAVHGFGLDNIRAEQTSVIQCVNVASTYSSAHDFHISHYSVLECNAGNLLAMYGQTGIALQNGGQLAVDSASGQIDIRRNTGPGIAGLQGGIGNLYNATGVRITDNGTYGITMAVLSAITLPVSGTTTFSGNGSSDVLMNQISNAITYGCALPKGSSPARGSSGNSGSYIY